MDASEMVLRTFDIGRPEPPAEVLDALERDGHERNGFCEKCWSEAYMRSLDNGEAQATSYLRLLDEEEARYAPRD